MPDVRSPERKVTVFPETALACAPIPGQAVAPEGREVVLVVQLELVVVTTKLDGKVMLICPSVPIPAEEGVAQTSAERGDEVFVRSKRTEATDKAAAWDW